MVLGVAGCQVVLDLIGIVALSDEAVGDGIDFVVALARDFLSDVLDVVVVPVFFFVDEGEGTLQSI